MRSKVPGIDRFQIAGFVLSVVVALVLIARKEDTISSFLVGLSIAIMTQLLDLQMRHRESEERILKAGLLNSDLYKDERFLSQIRNIVECYLKIKDYDLEPFDDRANDAVNDCSSILRGMSDGHMTVPHRTALTYGRGSIRNAKHTVKATVSLDPSYFRTEYGADFLRANEEAIGRGVSVTRIWVQDRSTLLEYRDVLEKQQSIGMRVLAVLTDVDKVPPALRDDIIISDDRILVTSELDSHGSIQNQRISLIQTEVRQAISNFDLLLRYARPLSQIYGTESTHSENLVSRET